MNCLTWLLYAGVHKQVIRIAMKLINRVHKCFECTSSSRPLSRVTRDSFEVTYRHEDQASPSKSLNPALELDHDRAPYAGFISSEIGTESSASGHASEAGRRGQHRARDKGCARNHRPRTRIRNRAGEAIVARCYATSTRPIRNVCMAIPKLGDEGDVLPGHPVECDRGIPGLVRIARVLREVGRAGDSVGSIDRRE